MNCQNKSNSCSYHLCVFVGDDIVTWHSDPGSRAAAQVTFCYFGNDAIVCAFIRILFVI